MHPPLDIVADANIPFAEAAFGRLGAVRRVPGRAITRDTLGGADVLLVRSVTPVDAALLAGTRVRFVGTATAGTEHVDRAALATRGVAFASAPGSNAASVVDYVLAALLALAADRGEALAGKTLGVVGVGAVGGRLAPRARALGMAVLACDPPRQADGQSGEWHALGEVLDRADVVTLHTPLTTAIESPWPTLGLIDAAAAARMRPGAWLVNAARGRVVTPDAALALARSRPVVLDTWPSEPEPTPALVEAAALATPHIAGYAADAKARGTAMLADALHRWLASDAAPWTVTDALGPGPPVDAPPADVAPTAWLDALARRVYDVRADDARFRATLAGTASDARATAFAALRKDYPERRELATATVRGAVPDALATAVRDGLGVSEMRGQRPRR
ncbi:4-phosphoerythronate dehydrogenase [Rubrivirga sp. IMCC43871]|uniref:4-phosphoerythronate dehydrogenase n=1 Tax=Rubrivirga sp. IMCC43871 TaxID=3391575 RepID=UPI00399004B5